MARISAKDYLPWKARGVIRRDARHDLEYLSDEASTGKVRGHRRKARKGCQHEYPEAPSNQRYGEVRCVHCGKGKWFYNPQAGYGYPWQRPKQDPTKVNGKAVAQEGFFPVHAEGTCATCDERRRLIAEARAAESR